MKSLKIPIRGYGNPEREHVRDGVRAALQRSYDETGVFSGVFVAIHRHMAHVDADVGFSRRPTRTWAPMIAL